MLIDPNLRPVYAIKNITLLINAIKYSITLPVCFAAFSTRASRSMSLKVVVVLVVLVVVIYSKCVLIRTLQMAHLSQNKKLQESF